MRVIKRDGTDEEMFFDKVTARIKNLCVSLDVQADRVAQKVFTSMYDGIRTSDIDTLSADVAVDLMSEHPDYETLATRITVSNLQKTCPETFSSAMVALHGLGAN